MPQNITVGGNTAANTTALATQLALDPATVKLGAVQSTEYRLGWQYVIRYSSTTSSDWSIVGEQAIAGTKGRPSSIQGVNGLTSVSHDTNFNGAGTPTDILKLADLVTLKPVVADTNNVLEIKNLANTTTASITGAGIITGSNLSGTNTGDQPTTAAEINAATAKPSIVDADAFGIWNSVGGLLAKFTWANLKTALSTVYQAITLTTKGDILVYGASLTRLPVGTNNQVLTADSAVANGVAWKTATGHIVQENSVDTANETRFNIVSANAEDVVQNNAGVATNYIPTIKSMNDFNSTGIVSGDLIGRNSSNTGFEPKRTAYFDEILRSTETNLSTSGIISTIIPADYSILGIRIKGDGTTTAGTFNIGTTALGSEIGIIPLTTTIETYVYLKKRWFSKVNETDMYISGISAGVIELEFILVKGTTSDEIPKNNIKELYATPTYYVDNTIKITKHYYIYYSNLYYEERFEYTSGTVSKIEVKDDLTGYWVRKTNIYDGNGLMQLPTIVNITAWTII